MSMQQFCLRWNNHQPNFISVFSNLLHNETLVDVTLAAEGHHLQAHKVVLSACSSYFQSLFTVNPCQHPIVILKDIKYSDLKIMVDFMYYGEVNVSQEQLPSIIKTAESLKIKGLAEMHSGSFSKWPSDSRERGESCSPSSPQTPSYRGRKRMRKSSTGSNSGSGDKADEISEITLVATNTIKPEPAIASQETGEGVRRPVNTNTESQGSIEEDQISIMSNMESNSAATPVQSETPIQDLNQQASNMSQSSTISQSQAHQEVEMDKGIFDFMTDEVIRDMIPDVDLRYRFKLKYDEYKSKLVAPVEKQFQEPPQPETDPLKTSDQMDDLMDIEEALFLDTEKISSEDSNIQENQNFAYVSYDSNFQSCSNQSDDGNSNKEPTITLKQLLNEDSTGREILKMYEKIGKVDRSKLATVIIQKETERDPDTRIRPDQFSYWAQEIVTLFSNEVKETYYVPYTRGPDGPVSARGILYTKYTNRRRSLRGKGILEPTKIRSKKNSRGSPSNDDRLERNKSTEIYEDDECLDWLAQNVEPIGEVIEKWTASSKERLSRLDNVTIDEHFEKYKCLQQDYGLHLIDIDFKYLHGDVCDKLHQTWPDIASKIVAFSKKQKHSEIKNFLALYNSEIQEGNINVLAIMLLPLLLKTVTMKSSFGDLVFRPTRENVQKNFIIHVQETAYIEDALKAHKKFLTDYKLSSYPIPVIVGSMDEIKSAFVYVNDVQYRLETPLKAVEACFKIFFAVNTDYPRICEHVWAFLEKYVFQFKRLHAPHYVSANILASDLGLS